MAEKIFTPAEASRTLPLVRRVVADVLVRGQELRALQRREHVSVDDEDRIQELAGQLEDLFQELEGVGCSFRCPSFEFGIVDFPAIIEGRPVHLCWRDDEPDLRYYHDPFAGYAGRKLIPAELLSQA